LQNNSFYRAKGAMAVNKIDVLADRGYFNGEILACEAISATPYVPRPLTSNAKAAGRFGKDDFIYLPDQNAYRCPVGENLRYRFTSVENGRTLHSYWTTKCDACPLKTKCTTSKERRVRRWEFSAGRSAAHRRGSHLSSGPPPFTGAPTSSRLFPHSHAR